MKAKRGKVAGEVRLASQVNQQVFKQLVLPVYFSYFVPCGLVQDKLDCVDQVSNYFVMSLSWNKRDNHIISLHWAD